MMRYLKYIFLSLISCILTMSCVKELDAPFYGDEVLTTLVPRVKSFTNQYVTKAYSSDEAAINSLSALIFDNDGKFVDIQSGTTSVTINKSMINSPANKEKLTSATIVMFANMSLDNITDASGKSIKENLSGLTLENIDGYTCKFADDKTVITDLSSFKDGFPMVGRATGVNLTSTKAQQNAITVNLKILYAKINFSIKVENGTENTGTGMQFAMTGYSVHNVSKAIELGEPEGATASSDYSYTSVTGKTVDKTGTVSLNDTDTPLTFTFYVAESRYEHNSDLKGIYPDDDWLTADPKQDVKNYDSATDEAKLNGVKYFYDDIIQQYKPMLANVEGGSPGQGLATYVLLKGTYTDYRGTVWTVNYKVYLGKDNSQNFHVDRNSEYTNHITIKGIRNNDSHSNGDVWVDHRVNVSTTDPSGYISITRETLIDAHIEVRPLRVQWEEGKYAGVRVYLPTKDGTLENWIGIERFTGKNCQDGATYCYLNGKSTGKRRYFTTDLISELQTKGGQFGVQEEEDENGNIKKFIYLQNGDCAWIYFDEHVSFKSYPTQPSPAREAVIKLEFFDYDGNKKAEEIYNVKQLGLQRRGGYNVESYEEYLHSYDSADKYNLSTTPADYTQQGLAWGLADKVVSQDIIVSRASIGSDIIKNLADSWFPDAKYDFFADSDTALFNGDNFYRYMKENGVWSSKSGDKETGLGFTNRATKNKIITVKDMGSAPENAYQYCLSKNKFEVDDEGNVKMVLNWYLPDVHQLAKVLNATAEGSSDFRSGDYYWSSQPSFTADETYQWGTTSFGLLDEVPENARARSKGGNPKDLPRSSKNRIRCLYTQNGQVADMTGRTPDGVGGLTTVIMKAYSQNTPGYFNYMLSSATTSNPKTSTVPFKNTSYAYPTVDSPGDDFGYFTATANDNSTVKGFLKNPTDRSNWQTYTLDNDYYYQLYEYPGLSAKETEKSRLVNASKDLTDDKKDVKVVTTESTRTLNSNLSGASLKTLDHLKEGNKLNISFNKGDNTDNNNPVFDFSENVTKRVETTTRYWIVPTYPDKSYTPKAAIYTKTYIKTGKATAIRESTAKANAEQAALKAAKDQASTDYPNCTYSYGTPAYSNYKYTNLRRTCEVTCTITITATTKTSVVSYFGNATGGGWGGDKTEVESDEGIKKDELRFYSGNSLTISLSDATDEDGVKYSEGYQITKVKIYYSGDNKLLEQSSGIIGQDKTTVYARFVDESITLPVPGDQTSHLGGWDYDDTNKTQQWAGSGTDSVTLTLADYVINQDRSLADLGNILTGKYTYTYEQATHALSKHIVIDRIDVKCTKKAAE